LGPELARLIGIVPALVVIAIGRVISAAGIWKLGVSRRA
jgi:hypothetical protein